MSSFEATNTGDKLQPVTEDDEVNNSKDKSSILKYIYHDGKVLNNGFFEWIQIIFGLTSIYALCAGVFILLLYLKNYTPGVYMGNISVVLFGAFFFGLFCIIQYGGWVRKKEARLLAEQECLSAIADNDSTSKRTD